jgi:hypothetical protein
MQIILPLLYAVFFIFLMFKMKFFDVPAISKLQLTGLFVLKIIAGLCVFAVYTFYYTDSDFNLYFESGNIIFDRFLGNTTVVDIPGWHSSIDDTLFNNSRIIIYLNFLIRFLSFNTIFVHIVFFCFLSFAGLTALYKSFYKYFPSKKNVLIVGLYFIPSVLFWTAGIYKETIAMFCVGFIVYLTDFGLEKNITLKKLIVVVALLLLLFFLKIYILAALLPLLLIGWILSKVSSRNYFLKFLLILFLFTGLFHLLSKTSERFNVYKLIADKQSKAISEAHGGIFLMNDKNFIRIEYANVNVLIPQSDSIFSIKKGSSFLSWKLDNMQDTTFVSGSGESAFYKLLYIISPAQLVIEIEKADPSFCGIVKKVPRSIFSVFTQPTLFKIKNVLQLLPWLENMWLLLILVLAILFFDKKNLQQKQVVLFALFFALIQFAVIGLTTPVIGAMVRYKVVALPFLYTIFMLCIDKDALLKKLKRSKSPDSERA